jgi:hypothetical protein
MARISKIFILILTLLSIPVVGLGQSGMKFAELAQRLDPYFDKDMILDIKTQLPQGTDYAIWGWDVGDFSGDGYHDVAVSLKLASDKSKTVMVYLFVDIDGYLTRVGTIPFKYFEMPLEIGVVIKNDACYATRKRKEFDWLIRGYTFIDGALIMLDEYTTNRVGNFTHESYHNYQNLTNTEKYLQTNSGKVELTTKYLTIPSYQRGRELFKGYSSKAVSCDVDFVPKGAYYWHGEDDACFSVRSAYDEQFLYMTIDVTDDNVVTQRCDSCPCDYIDVWFDVIPPYQEKGDRFINQKDKKITFRTSSEIGIYCFSFYPGNFLDKKAFMKISTTDDLESYQKLATKNIKVVSSLRKNGFVLKYKIPFTMLGFEEFPMAEGKSTEFGCTVVYHDIDNEYRPEEESQIATSAFSSLNPSTYGSLILIPPEEWYGDTINIYKDDIVKALSEFGY